MPDGAHHVTDTVLASGDSKTLLGVVQNRRGVRKCPSAKRRSSVCAFRRSAGVPMSMNAPEAWKASRPWSTSEGRTSRSSEHTCPAGMAAKTDLPKA